MINLIINTDNNDRSSDWLKYGRLEDKADSGDKKAKKKLEEAEKTIMVVWKE